MEEPTRKIGPYTLTSELGSGAFGVVWLAEKQTTIATTRVALKLPHNKNIDIEDFRKEAAIWIQASGHPNVLPLIDADIYDEQVVIVSEYAPDGSLSGWLRQHGGRAPSIEAACEMIDGILAGLAHLHGRRIIHRDLKPDNILLQGDTPRLADFGISRLLSSDLHSLTIGGTPAYMAPEAFRFMRDEKTDIWAVGVILYQLLAGRRPYDRCDLESLKEAITQEDPPPLPEFVPADVRAIVMKALQRDPGKRYKTAAEMRHALREAKHRLWLGEQKTISVPVVPPAPIPEPATPHPQPVKPQPPTPAVVPEPPEAKVSPGISGGRKLRRWLWLAGVIVTLLLGTTLVIRFYLTSSSDNSKQTLTRYVFPIYSVAFSPDGEMLASGSSDSMVKLWEVQTGELKQTLPGHSGSVLSVAFSPDGKMLASGSFDETVRLWDAQTGKLKKDLSRHTNVVHSVAFSPDGKMLASGSFDNTVKLWEVQTGEFKKDLPSGHNNFVYSVAFSPDRKMLASGSYDNTVKLWEVQTGTVVQNLDKDNYQVNSVTFSPDGKMLASGSYDDTVRLWDAQTGKVTLTLPGPTNIIYSIAFSPDGKMLASGSFDNMVRLWDVQTGKLIRTLPGHTRRVWSVAFSPDGKTLASGSDDGTVRLWEVQTGELKQILT